MGLFSKKTEAAGVAIKDHCLRFTEIKKGETPVIVKCGELSIEKGIISEGRIADENSFVLLADQFAKENKLKGKKVLLSIPESSLIVRRIELPAEIEEDEVKSYLSVEIGTSIRLPIENPIFDVVVSKNKPGTAILFALPEETMNGYIKVLQMVKIKPIAVEVPTLSLYRLLHIYKKVEDEKNYLILQLDKSGFVVSIFTNHEPELIRNYPVNEDELQEDFSTLFYEVERVINFFKYSLYQGEVEIDDVFITGDHLGLGNFKQMIGTRFSFPVITFELENVSWQTAKKPEEQYLLPLGICLKEGGY